MKVPQTTQKGLLKAKSMHSFGYALQQAIDIEIATIPLYLYTYYSIKRVPDQNAIIAYYSQKLMDKGATEEEACKTAKTLSIKIMVYANKAAANIMSVAVEEMLHMALISNVKQALRNNEVTDTSGNVSKIGMPQIVNRAPTSFPTALPGHTGDFKVPLAPLSVTQLANFMKIEQPDYNAGFGVDGALPPIDTDYTTIGEFYTHLQKYIEDNEANLNFDESAAQIYPDQEYNRNGYYTPNNVNTIYYDENHKMQYANSDHSGGLIKVIDVQSALEAMALIVEQGEGSQVDPHDAGEELAHFYKFKELKEELTALRKYLKKEFTLTLQETTQEYEALKSFFIIELPTNPKTSDYPEDIQAVSNYLNALYSYHFSMTEACYRYDNPKQGAIMLYGLHKSMFFILSVLCSFIMSLTYTAADGKTYHAAPTFEPYVFQPGSTAKEQLIALNKKVPAHLNMTPNQLARISVLPDVDIVPMENMQF